VGLRDCVPYDYRERSEVWGREGTGGEDPLPPESTTFILPSNRTINHKERSPFDSKERLLLHVRFGIRTQDQYLYLLVFPHANKCLIRYGLEKERHLSPLNLLCSTSSYVPGHDDRWCVRCLIIKTFCQIKAFNT